MLLVYGDVACNYSALRYVMWNWMRRACGACALRDRKRKCAKIITWCLQAGNVACYAALVLCATQTCLVNSRTAFLSFARPAWHSAAAACSPPTCNMLIQSNDLRDTVCVEITKEACNYSYIPCPVILRQEAQLSQRGRAEFRVIEYFAKSLKVTLLPFIMTMAATAFFSQKLHVYMFLYTPCNVNWFPAPR